MSDALNTLEVEDVLSSIRRLVSDDIRPAPRDQDPGDAEANKLLLTPALRVVSSETDEQERGLEAVVAALSAGVAQQDAEWEPETGDLSMAAVGFAEVVEADIWEDAPVIEDYAAPLDFVSSRRTATDDLPEMQDETQVEAPLAEATENAADQPLPGWAQSTGAEDTEAPRPDPTVRPPEEPDTGWADAAEAAVLQELQGSAAQAAFDPPYGSDDFVLNESDAPELPVDEAMLREIVRDVLREELQGRLGERITRNIRKLVRAEIARVVASEDLI